MNSDMTQNQIDTVESDTEQYASLFAAMERGLLVTVNESDPHTSGAGEMMVLGSKKDGTVVDFQRGNEVFTAQLENSKFHLYKRGPEWDGERHWCEVVTIEVVGFE